MGPNEQQNPLLGSGDHLGQLLVKEFFFKFRKNPILGADYGQVANRLLEPKKQSDCLFESKWPWLLGKFLIYCKKNYLKFHVHIFFILVSILNYDR